MENTKQMRDNYLSDLTNKCTNHNWVLDGCETDSKYIVLTYKCYNCQITGIATINVYVDVEIEAVDYSTIAKEFNAKYPFTFTAGNIRNGRDISHLDLTLNDLIAMLKDNDGYAGFAVQNHDMTERYEWNDFDIIDDLNRKVSHIYPIYDDDNETDLEQILAHHDRELSTTSLYYHFILDEGGDKNPR